MQQVINFSKYGKTVVAGQPHDDAEAWLRLHGAIIERELGITIILLPKDARVSEGSTRSEYTIDFYHGDNEPSEWCELELDIDAGTTILRLVKEG